MCISISMRNKQMKETTKNGIGLKGFVFHLAIFFCCSDFFRHITYIQKSEDAFLILLRSLGLIRLVMTREEKEDDVDPERYFFDWTFELAHWQKRERERRKKNDDYDDDERKRNMISLHFVSFFLFVHPSIFYFVFMLQSNRMNESIYIKCVLAFISLHVNVNRWMYIHIHPWMFFFSSFFLSFRGKKKKRKRKEMYMNAS